MEKTEDQEKTDLTFGYSTSRRWVCKSDMLYRPTEGE